MKLSHENVVALVIKPCPPAPTIKVRKLKKWDIVCATEYLSDGRWVLGMNMVTSIDDVLDTAEKNGLNIMFESQFVKKK